MRETSSTSGEWWARTHPKQPRLGIGDLTPRRAAATRIGHASHENGLDVDIRLVRADGVEGPADPASYDRELTQALVDRLVGPRRPATSSIGPSLDLHGPAGIVVRGRTTTTTCTGGSPTRTASGTDHGPGRVWAESPGSRGGAPSPGGVTSP